MRKTLSAALALALAALAITACGGSNANQQYINAVNAAHASLAQSMNKTAGSITASTTLVVDQAALRSEAQSVHDLGDSLSDIKPPKKVAAAHNAYVVAIYRMASVMQTAAGGNTATFVADFQKVRDQEHEALRAINLALKSK